MDTDSEIPFSFLELAEIRDGELWLELRKKVPASPAKGYVPAYFFNIRLDGVETPVGHIDLRVGNVPNLVLYGGHIGYGVEEKWRNKNLATRSCKLLFPIALKHGLECIWITCRPDNHSSSRVCEKAGGEFIDFMELPADHEMRQEEGRTHSKRFKFDLKKLIPEQKT